MIWGLFAEAIPQEMIREEPVIYHLGEKEQRH